MKAQFTLEVELSGDRAEDDETLVEYFGGPEDTAREILYSAPAFDGKDWIDHLQFEGVVHD